ncbi:MAG: ADP-ribosylglycohydrolase family protein [Myxococcota bacterium]
MLIELAIGDAYGAAFEYARAKFISRYNHLQGYARRIRGELRPGQYTDDTQMSLAIVEAMLSEERWTAPHLARRFVEVFKRDPRQGYAKGFYRLLVDVSDGEELLSRLRPHSDKSGAAMRASAIGVWPSVGQVVDRCRVQARITHDTPDGINAALAAALMTHYFIYDHGPKHELGRFLEIHVPGQWSLPWMGEVGPKGWMSVRAAVATVVDHDRMSDILKAAVDWGGDVDTVAAIALAAASCASEVEQDLPEVLVEGLEQGPWGRPYLARLDGSLMAMAGRESRWAHLIDG